MNLKADDAFAWLVLSGFQIASFLLGWLWRDGSDDALEKAQRRAKTAERELVVASDRIELLTKAGGGYAGDLFAAQERVERLEEALEWCGGSGDFAPGGSAHEGWQRSVRPLLEGRRRAS